MTGKESVIKHLEMIQGIINRLGHDSFLVKGWSMTILAAGIIFVARSEVCNDWFVLTFLIPVIGFWILDGYFLWQEKLFREVYNEVRGQENTKFAMDQMKHAKKPECRWVDYVFSITLKIFYGMEMLFVAGVLFLLLWK